MLKASATVKLLLAKQPFSIHADVVAAVLMPCSDDDTPEAVGRLLGRIGGSEQTSPQGGTLADALDEGSHWGLVLPDEILQLEVLSVVGALAFVQMLRTDLWLLDMPDLHHRNRAAVMAAAAQQIRVYFFG